MAKSPPAMVGLRMGWLKSSVLGGELRTTGEIGERVRGEGNLPGQGALGEALPLEVQAPVEAAPVGSGRERLKRT